MLKFLRSIFTKKHAVTPLEEKQEVELLPVSEEFARAITSIYSDDPKKKIPPQVVEISGIEDVKKGVVMIGGCIWPIKE